MVMMTARSMALCCIYLLCSGCCHVPDVDRHFKTDGPHEAVRYFRYAIDAGQYSAAYRCLSATTQDRISELAFEAMLRFSDVPQLGDIPLLELLVFSSIDPVPEPISVGQPEQWVTLIWSSEDQLIQYSLFLQPDSAGRWQIDLLLTRGVDLGGAM